MNFSRLNSNIHKNSIEGRLSNVNEINTNGNSIMDNLEEEMIK